MSKWPEPPTEAEFNDIIRRHEREVEIPERLRDIENWVAQIKATPDDIRNKPDIQPNRREGGTFVSMVTDLDTLLQSCAAVRRRFQAGEFELALSAMRSVESCVRAINARVTAPLIKIGTDVRNGAKMGGRQDPDRDLRMAREFQRKWQQQKHSNRSKTALMEDIGQAHDLKRSAAIDAIKRGLAKIVR